ncbi:endonuclease G, mitochondrial-like [Drosophila pseudoobscura]|uniref:Endonuclease G, mitochondrial-like n=1 Tax=Drosophila pseudoobscura pseudoobscura TaxID=46245 RepID=B5DNS4_DROPS|nr:endonuclease G, mitochondrial [Drosophila pseudoobscura]
MPQPQDIALYASVGVAAFVCGAFLQQETSINNLFDVIKRDPYVYHNRRKLYPVLSTFSTNHEARLWSRPVGLKDKICDRVKPLLKFLLPKPKEEMGSEEPPLANVLDLLKYGLPSAEHLVVHKDYIMSRGMETKSATWICEHFRAGSSPDEPEYLRYTDVFLLTGACEEIGRVFRRPIWQELERYVTLKTQECGSLYTYTGPIFTPKNHGTGKSWLEYRECGNASMPVPVPSHYFKVLIIEESQVPGGDVQPVNIEAYVIKNGPSDMSGCLCEHRVRIKDIEEQTGLRFNKEQQGPKVIKNKDNIEIEFTCEAMQMMSSSQLMTTDQCCFN